MRAILLPHEAWLDEFFASYYTRRPVDATFVGAHVADDRLPDVSENSLGDAHAQLTNLLARAPSPDTPGLPLAHAIDLRLARGSLRIELAELTAAHSHFANPSFYASEAVFGVLSLFLRDAWPPTTRFELAAARLDALPAFLEHATANMRRAPRHWTERALRECHGAMLVLRDGVDLLAAGAATHSGQAGNHEPASSSPDAHTDRFGSSQLAARSSVPAAVLASFRRAADRAAAAFVAFRVHVEGLRQRPVEEYAAGEALFELYMLEGHVLEASAAEIRERAMTELVRAEHELATGLTALGLRDIDDLNHRLASIHPSADTYLQRFNETARAMRSIAESSDLMTWPDAPLRFVPQPRWARAVAPYLYFPPYRSPAALDFSPRHDHFVPPLDTDWPQAQQTELLRATNDSVIKLNHVIHHGGIGHHVQNWHAFRAESRIGRIAAVDGASRIALFCGGTMAEGWACYATDLMAEAGALTPLERLAEVRSRIRMCARAVVDVSLHHGEMTIEQAADFYANRAAMPAAAALVEAVKNSMFPGAALIYSRVAMRSTICADT